MRDSSDRNTRITPFLIALTALLMPSKEACSDSTFELVTAVEHQLSLTIARPEELHLQTRSIGDHPQITLVSPKLDETGIRSPVDVEMEFLTTSDASIDMASLRIYYLLLFKKDITERVLEHAELGESRVRATGAKLPVGKHSFLVEISDTLLRTSRLKFNVVVDE